MRLCILRMRLCKGYTDKEKRKMKTCDSHVNEEVKFVTDKRLSLTVDQLFQYCLSQRIQT